MKLLSRIAFTIAALAFSAHCLAKSFELTDEASGETGTLTTPAPAVIKAISTGYRACIPGRIDRIEVDPPSTFKAFEDGRDCWALNFLKLMQPSRISVFDSAGNQFTTTIRPRDTVRANGFQLHRTDLERMVVGWLSEDGSSEKVCTNRNLSIVKVEGTIYQSGEPAVEAESIQTTQEPGCQSVANYPWADTGKYWEVSYVYSDGEVITSIAKR